MSDTPDVLDVLDPNRGGQPLTANSRLEHRRVAMDKLVVTPGRDEKVLIVDAQALMRAPNQVRYWWLHAEDDGTWSHYPSGERNHPLATHLWSISMCYDPPARDVASPTVDSALLEAWLWQR